jgi:hypothetical protein
MNTGNYANHSNTCKLGSHINQKINGDVSKHGNNGNIRAQSNHQHSSVFMYSVCYFRQILT